MVNLGNDELFNLWWDAPDVQGVIREVWDAPPRSSAIIAHALIEDLVFSIASSAHKEMRFSANRYPTRFGDCVRELAERGVFPEPFTDDLLIMHRVRNIFAHDWDSTLSFDRADVAGELSHLTMSTKGSRSIELIEESFSSEGVAISRAETLWKGMASQTLMWLRRKQIDPEWQGDDGGSQ